MRTSAIPLALLFLAAMQAPAQRIPWRTTAWSDTFTSFDTVRYATGSDTRHDSATGTVQLTASLPGKAGRLFLRVPLDLDVFDAGFDVFFGYRSPANNGGADGIVFTLAREIAYPVSYGGKLNFDGCLGFGVEFDTYQNTDENDPSEQHIAGLMGYSDLHRGFVNLPPGSLEDNRWHTYTVRNRRGMITIFSAGQPLLTFPIDSGFTGYAGFTSATGFAFNEHGVDNVFLTVPARAAADLGIVSTCPAPIVRKDTAARIINNHPDGPLALTALTLEDLDGGGEFSLVAPPALPLVLAAGDSVAIALRFSGSGAGTRRAVLHIGAGNGESILDTVGITLEEPRARWDASLLAFPRTHAGTASDTTIMLINTSRVAARIEGLSASPSEFSVVAPAAWPVDLAPGDTLTVTLRFAPLRQGTSSGTLAVAQSCGDYRSVALGGEGYASTIAIGCEWPPLMLRPGGIDTLLVSVLSDPREAGIRSFSGVILYDPTVADFQSAFPAVPALPGTTVSAVEPAPGRIALDVRSPLPLAGTGPWIALRFLAARGEEGCTDVAWDTATWNSEGPLPGVPTARTVTGRICINPSCRVPGGLVSTAAAPQLRVAPLPARGSATVTVTMPFEAAARVTLATTAGSMLRRLHDGLLPAGTRALTVATGDLPSGCYIILLETNGGLRTAPLLLLR